MDDSPEAIRRTRQSLRRVAAQYDELLLALNVVPDDAWNLVRAVFSEQDFLKKRGLDTFLIELSTWRRMRADTQLATSLRGLIPARSRKALEKLATGHAREKQVAFVGLDVLRHRADGQLLRRALALHGSASPFARRMVSQGLRS